MRFLLALPLALAATTPAAARTPVIQAKPALWKLADADTTIYLFGTIHVLPPAYRWHGPVLEKAIAAARSLTLETVLDVEPAKVAGLLTTLGRAEGLPPLSARVPPARRAALAALIARSGIPAATLDTYKSWAAAILLTGAALQQIGVATTADSGIEPQLTALFRQAGKPVDGFETPEEQLGFFDGLPEASQRVFLAETLESPAKAGAEFRAMLAAWTRGDVAAIARIFADEPEFTPELRDRLIVRRNAAWAVALAKRLETPGTVFVAVGAGHLAGPQDVQRMLAARRLKVVRLQ